MINFALLTKSNARKAQSILDVEEQFCCAEEVANAGQAKSTLDDHLEEIQFVVQMISNERHSQVFINEMIMRCEKYQILVGHSPFLTIIIIIRFKR